MEHVGPVEQVIYVERPAPKHSGVGIASFIISLCSGFALFAALVFAAVVAAAAGDGEIDEEAPAVIILGLAILMLLVMELVALGLGIGGLCQKERKKVFAILGVIFSGLAILGIIGLMVIGSGG